MSGEAFTPGGVISLRIVTRGTARLTWGVLPQDDEGSGGGEDVAGEDDSGGGADDSGGGEYAGGGGGDDGGGEDVGTSDDGEGNRRGEGGTGDGESSIGEVALPDGPVGGLFLVRVAELSGVPPCRPTGRCAIAFMRATAAHARMSAISVLFSAGETYLNERWAEPLSSVIELSLGAPEEEEREVPGRACPASNPTAAASKRMVRPPAPLAPLGDILDRCLGYIGSAAVRSGGLPILFPWPPSPYHASCDHNCMYSRVCPTWMPFVQVLERLEQAEASRGNVFEPHPLVGGGHAGPARTPNMAIDKGILRDCLQHLLALCYAWHPDSWNDGFCDAIKSWVHDYAFNAYIVLTRHATPDRTGQVPFSPAEREAHFYACRRAMAGLSVERDLIVHQGAHAYRAAVGAGHTVLDGQDVNEDAFRSTFGWWTPAERLHFRTAQELRPFRQAARLRRAAARLATPEEAIVAAHLADSWERDWYSSDFEREYAIQDEGSEGSTSSELSSDESAS
ncbi:hypothetical protein K488DRAFT_74619 [Vararia minispora EC-137]|uniref:Uncharacterized protein n=1 Tax=Vararia minispora EC-137 TaxID=1314806 RepID=A0ACB8Q6E4_9AGAM|nr:hypothetical protein K488DRAFT_74619 [Vararia minispora EC-137]